MANTNDIFKLTGLGGVTGMSSASQITDPKKLAMLNGADVSVLTTPSETGSNSFDALLKSAMDMINETNRYTNEAAEAELAYAMGVTNSTADLQVAQMKANISLQYTVAVRNAVIDAYKEIMQLQF